MFWLFVNIALSIWGKTLNYQICLSVFNLGLRISKVPGIAWFPSFFMFAILPLESVLPRRCLLPNQVSPQGSLYCSPPPSLLGTWVWTPLSWIMHSWGKLFKSGSVGALHVLILNSMTTSTTLPTTSIFSKNLYLFWILLCYGAKTGTITV